jgi:PAS domain S-box-containing protein
VSISERVLILAPRGRDAVVAETILREAGLERQAVPNFSALAAELSAGAGAAIVADEAVDSSRIEDLRDWVAEQPSWSDLPFVFLTRRYADLERSPYLLRISEILGNVIFLERPFHPRALVNSVSNALRDRRRQYQARANLERLAEGEKRLALALKAGRLGTWSIDVESRTLYASEDCKAIFGRRFTDTFSYDDLLNAIDPAERAGVEAGLENSMQTGNDIAVESRVRMPDGNSWWVEIRGSVMPDRYNQRRTLAGVASDITARKRAEMERENLLRALDIERELTQSALRGEKAFSGLLVRSVPAGIVTYDRDLRITTWNPLMERLAGSTESEVLGRPLLDVMDGRTESVAARMQAALAGADGPAEEHQFEAPGAGTLWLEIQHAPLRSGDGEIVGGVAFVRDTTERRKAEEQLRQVQKMEIIGQLTGGVAHDFNNLLAAVLGNLELLRKKIPDEPQLLRHVDGAMQGAQRGASLTQRLLAFARRQDLKPRPVDLASLLEGMRALMERSLGPMISIDLQLAAGLPPASVDPNQLELAILNLAVNARDAMPEGGKLTIRTSEGTPPPRLGLVGSFVRVEVEDTGSGMDEETLQRAIEPFFSTKELGKGTGLGLSMVHGLAVQLGGALHLSSRPGSGTTVALWLPLTTQPVEAVAAEEPREEAAPSSSILVVDDDALIAMNTVSMVEDLGHTVLEAYSGKQALEILQSDARIDALITDYAMPGMTGVELAVRARELRPGLPILLATGYAELPDGTTLDLPRLGKPYQQRDLSQHLSRLLAQKAPTGNR